MLYSSSSMRSVFIIQNRAIRIMLRLGPRSSCREDFKKLDILRVPCLYIYAFVLFSVKHLNIYQSNSSVHGFNTRQQNELHIPSVEPPAIQRGVCYTSVNILKQLPQNIFKYCNNIHTFMTLLRDYPVKNAFYSTEEFQSAGHNDVDIWTSIFNLFYYCVCNNRLFVVCVLTNLM
jgi:hypothetical protein